MAGYTDKDGTEHRYKSTTAIIDTGCEHGISVVGVSWPIPDPGAEYGDKPTVDVLFTKQEELASLTPTEARLLASWLCSAADACETMTVKGQY